MKLKTVGITLFISIFTLRAQGEEVCEQALLTTGHHLGQVFSDRRIDPELYGPKTGLREDQLAVLRSPKDVAAFLALPTSAKAISAESHSLLSRLTVADFAKHFFVVSSLGISQWSRGPIYPLDEVRYDEWIKTQEQAQDLDPDVIRDWGQALLNRKAGIPGVNIEMNAELRTSVKMAMRAAVTVREPQRRQSFLWLEDAGGRMGYAKLKAPELFRVALQIEAVRGIGLDEKSIKEAYSFGERVRDQGFRKLMLPFYLTEKNKVRLTQANIRHLILMALRYSHFRQMIRAPNERLFNSDQCLLLAVFPELAGFVQADRDNALWLNQMADTIAVSNRYKFGMGEADRFWWDLANPRWLLPELQNAGLGSVHFNMHVVRYFDHRQKELGPFELQLSLTPYSLEGAYTELSYSEKGKLEVLLNQALNRYVKTGSALKLKILDSQDNGKTYGISVDGRERSDSLGVLETFARFAELSHAWFKARPTD